MKHSRPFYSDKKRSRYTIIFDDMDFSICLFSRAISETDKRERIQRKSKRLDADPDRRWIALRGHYLRLKPRGYAST